MLELRLKAITYMYPITEMVFLNSRSSASTSLITVNYCIEKVQSEDHGVRPQIYKCYCFLQTTSLCEERPPKTTTTNKMGKHINTNFASI